jgi:hypothetical protein
MLRFCDDASKVVACTRAFCPTTRGREPKKPEVTLARADLGFGDHLTVPRDMGSSLDRTRRTHPHVYRFVSEIVYDKRLVTLPDLGLQKTSRLVFAYELSAGFLRPSHPPSRP